MTELFWLRKVLLTAVGLGLVACFGHGAPAQEPDEVEVAPIKPDYAAAVLRIGDRELKPLATYEVWSDERDVGDYVIRIQDDVESDSYDIECLDRATRKSRWKKELPIGERYGWLGVHGDCVLLLKKGESHDSDSGHDADCVIERYQLVDGKQVESLKPPLSKKERKLLSYAVEVLPIEEDLLVLNVSYKAGGFEDERVGYRLTRFKKDTTEILWSRDFTSGGERESPGAFILGGGRGNAIDNESLQSLTVIGENVLVCAGPLEDVMMIQPKDGATKWTVPRLWEFRRGFIGPSVWRHFLGRHGMEDHDLETAKLTLEQVRERNQGGSQFVNEEYFKGLQERVKRAEERSAAHPGWIVAGPIVIPEKDAYLPNHHIFFATALSDGGPWQSYLSDCVVYQLTSSGRVVAMTKLPRFVIERQILQFDKIFVWFCIGIFQARIEPSPSGLMGSDCLVDFEWARLQPMEEHGYWYRNGSGPSSVALHDFHRFECENGGFIESEQSKVYQFPISVRNFKESVASEMLLHCPFAGTIPTPTIAPGKANDPG